MTPTASYTELRYHSNSWIVGIDNSRGWLDLGVKWIAGDRVRIFGTITLIFPVMVMFGVHTISVAKSTCLVLLHHFGTCEVQYIGMGKSIP